MKVRKLRNGGAKMELARLTSKGQITIPKDIRNKLNLKEGDKVLFIEEDDKIVLVNSSMVALKEMQDSMKGQAEKQKLYTEADVNDLVNDVRNDTLEKKSESNA